MRILMISHEFTVTGASRIFLALAQHLRQAGHALVLAPANPAEGPMTAGYTALGVPIMTAVDLAEFDLAIANTVAVAGQVLQIGARLPTIWYLHEAEIGLALLLRHPLWAGAFQVAAAIIYNTPAQHDVFRSFTYALDQGKFHVVPFGVETGESARACDAVPGRARRLRVVQVGTLEARKRPGDLIQAVALSGLDIECVFCGKLVQLGEAARKMLAMMPERFRIVENAPRGEVLGWTASADIVCLASSSETQGLAVYEAALLGRPLLLTDLPCYRGVFVHGRQCLMVPVGDIEMLAASLALLAAHPALARRLGLAARAVARRYGRAAFFARFDSVILGVLGCEATHGLLG